MKKLYFTLLIALLIPMFLASAAVANTLLFSVEDSNNDDNVIVAYNIYTKYAGGPDTYQLEGSVPDQVTELAVVFLDGYTYSVIARAMDSQGRESGNSAEFQVAWQNGHPTYPDGPNPPSILKGRRP